MLWINDCPFIWYIYSYDSLLFMVNICFLNNFVNTRGYPWIPADMKKIDGYPHNRYPTDMGMGTGQIFIQRVGYGGATTRILPAPLTSLERERMTSSWLEYEVCVIHFKWIKGESGCIKSKVCESLWVIWWMW